MMLLHNMMAISTTPIPGLALSTIGGLGLATHKNINYTKLGPKISTPLVIGIISLLLTRTSAVTTPPARLASIMQHPVGRVFFVLTLSFLASPDVENAVFLSMLFLGLLQVMRTKEERKEHPYIL